MLTRVLLLASVPFSACFVSACLNTETVPRQDVEQVLISYSEPLWFDDFFVEVPGAETPVGNAWSYLVRYEDKIVGHINTSDVPEDHIVTVWYASFDAPASCELAHDCTRYDFANPRVGASFMSAGTGIKASPEGLVVVTGKMVREGQKDVTRVGSGLTNAGANEVHVMVRDHGPPIEGLEELQRTTFTGGCSASGDPAATYNCYMMQYAKHSTKIALPGVSTTSAVFDGEVSNSASPLADPQLDKEAPHSTLVRSERLGVLMGHIQTELTPGDAISATIYGFNDPSACSAGAGACLPIDAENPATDATVLTSEGGVVAEDGTIRVSIGPISGAEPLRVLTGSGEIAQDAEVVVALRSHGPVIPEIQGDQIRTYDGGCDVNTCQDVQFVRHVAEAF